MCTVILSKTIGCSLPLIAKKCGLDPAIMAAPLITTLVDTGTIFVLLYDCDENFSYIMTAGSYPV